MSSLAFVNRAAHRRSARRSLVDLLEERGGDVLLAVSVLAMVVALLAFLPGAFSVDSWLALVSGRQVWESGIPHHETLTALSYGSNWVDQQWLSELTMYAIYRAGGLALMGTVNVAMLALGVGGAIVAARRLGASSRAVLLVLPVCLWLMLPSREVRTQAFVIPLFVAVVYLLARDSRAPSRAVYWCLPILVLWSNLHGTVSLGVGLVCLRGLTIAWERRALLVRSLRAWRRPLALVVGAPLCLLITPYGLSAVSYYHTMFFSSSVRQVVTEWQPITSAFLTAAPFFVAAGVAVWSFGRYRDRTTLFEKLAIIALAAGSVLVIRNVLFFGLCAVALGPLSLDPGSGKQNPTSTAQPRRRALINGALLATALATTLLAVVATAVRPSSAFELSYQRIGVLQAVTRATSANPSLKILADVRFSDWLLWRDPALSGRVDSDARFELLTAGQIGRLQAVFNAIGPGWKRGATGYGLILLDRKYTPDAVQGFLQEPGHRVLYDDGERIVILRSSRAAA